MDRRRSLCNKQVCSKRTSPSPATLLLVDRQESLDGGAMKKIFGRAAAAGGGGNGGGGGGGCSPSSDAAPGGGGGGGGPGDTPSLPPNCGPWNVGRHKNLVRSRKAFSYGEVH